MICPNCGKEIVEKSLFCNYCGSAVKQINKSMVGSTSNRKAQNPASTKVFWVIMILSSLVCIIIIGVVLPKRTHNLQNSSPNSDTESEDKTNDNHISKIGYELAEYDRFDSPGYENGLIGTLVYVDGVVKELKSTNLGRKQDGMVYHLSVIDDSGEEWLVYFGVTPFVSESKLNHFLGNSIRVYGCYKGQSIDYEKPSIEVHEIDMEGDSFTVTDVLSDSEWLKNWCDNNECDLYIDEISVSENEFAFGKTLGIVDELWTNSDKMSVITKESSGKFTSYIFDMNKSYTEYTEYYVDLSSLNYHKNDNVAIYYRIQNGIPYVLGIYHVADVGFGSYNRFQYYKDNSLECDYKDLARNPESMKGELIQIKGQVWKVDSNGNQVSLMVYSQPFATGSNVYTNGELLVTYYKESASEDNILYKDIVTIYGWVKGENTSNTTYSNGQPVIDIDAEYIVVQ